MSMNADKLRCVSCGVALPGGASVNDPPIERTCIACQTRQIVCHFPAQTRLAARATDDAQAQTGDAVCFHHAERQAEAVCDSCGRFLCGLCRIDFNGRTLCPACLALTQTAAPAEAHIPRHIRYDKIALLCILLSPFLYILSFVNAGISLFLCIRYWKRPQSILPVNRWRFVLAGSLSVLVLASWVIGVGWMIAAYGIAKDMRHQRDNSAESSQTEEDGDDN